ncbi:unnamed protein product, partial [Rodentolepis nana]|uniref:BTB domain-containing protein n=1 Tax=Rodentolepis nana TaxID=102285 RepID=A0A0R3TID6_RODNA
MFSLNIIITCYFKVQCLFYHFFPVNSLMSTLKKRLSGNFGEESSSIGACATPRTLECGSKLVTVVAKGSKTVLQMPRGNIEDIHPRALVFNQLTPAFDELRHAEVIEIMRRHRINFNLLYDYCPRKFLSNINNFVNSISSPDHITLLVSDLSNFITLLSLLV